MRHNVYCSSEALPAVDFRYVCKGTTANVPVLWAVGGDWVLQVGLMCPKNVLDLHGSRFLCIIRNSCILEDEGSIDVCAETGCRLLFTRLPSENENIFHQPPSSLSSRSEVTPPGCALLNVLLCTDEVVRDNYVWTLLH